MSPKTRTRGAIRRVLRRGNLIRISPAVILSGESFGFVNVLEEDAGESLDSWDVRDAPASSQSELENELARGEFAAQHDT